MTKTTPKKEPVAATGEQAVPALGTMVSTELRLVYPSKTNPRTHFDNAALNELAESIRKLGVLQAILVRPVKDKFEIVAGERRFRAAKLAGLSHIPANIRDLDDKQTLEVQVVENLQRTDLSPMEEARGYEQLVHKHGYVPAVLAAKIGKSESYIRKRMQLAQLEPGVQKALESGEIPLGHALLLARIPDAKLQIEALQIAERDGASLKELAEIISNRFMLMLAKAPFDITDKLLVPAAGSCGDCPYRTGNQKELFDDVKGADICTKPTCYSSKVGAWWKSSETKEKKIPIDQNMGILQGPHYGGTYSVVYSGKYQDLDEKRYDLTNKTYGQFLKGKVSVYLALDGAGKVWRLGLKKEIESLMKSDPDIKKALKAAKQFSSPSNSPWRDEEKKRKLQAAKRKEILLKLREKFLAAVPEKTGVVKHLQLLRHILFVLVTESWRVEESYSQFVWPDTKGKDKNAIQKHIATLTERDCWTHIFIAIFFSNADMTNVLNAGNYEELKGLLKLFGINPKPVEDAVEKEYAEKAKLKKAKELAAKKKAAKSVKKSKAGAAKPEEDDVSGNIGEDDDLVTDDSDEAEGFDTEEDFEEEDAE